MAKINHTQLSNNVLNAIFKASQKARKLKQPQVLKNSSGAPWLVVRYAPIFKRARFEVTTLYGDNLQKELDKSFKNLLLLERQNKLTLGKAFKLFFNKAMV